MISLPSFFELAVGLLRFNLEHNAKGAI